MPAVTAAVTIELDGESVFAFLCDLDNHWRIAGRFIQVMSLEGQPGARRGGTVRVRGPLGLTRTVRTRMVAIRPPESIVGEAFAGRDTVAEVRWRVRPCGAASTVELAVEIRRAAGHDRLLLRLGGNRWLARRLAGVLAELGRTAPAWAATRESDRPTDPVPAIADS